MHSLKRRLSNFSVLRSPFSVLRSPVSPCPVHRLKLNTVFRLTFILLLGGAGLTACVNLQKEQTAHKQGNDVAVWSAEWLKTKAEQGDADGQVILGFMYQEGRGVPQDDQLAVQWYRKAAEQGNASGQSNLGFMYKEGRGVPQDDQLAVQWYRKAAEQGDAAGQINLGWMYKEGRGVPKNYVYAYMWMDIASDGFTEEVGRVLKEPVGVLMTPSQIQKAKALARACERKQY